VLITKKLAEKVWPGAASVIGKTLYFGTGEKANGAQVVGVVETLQSPGRRSLRPRRVRDHSADAPDQWLRHDLHHGAPSRASATA
jgi:hypothetical protein